jgi:hypothetical protein
VVHYAFSTGTGVQCYHPLASAMIALLYRRRRVLKWYHTHPGINTRVQYPVRYAYKVPEGGVCIY